jgi:hypothetical protein
VVLAPALDERPPAAGPAEAALVVGLDREARLRELASDVVVAARMLGQAVDEEDRGPRLAGGEPAPDEQLRPVPGGDLGNR